ncbi:two-component system sensor histidine kinase VanS [Catenulispora sp. EB89]|uniref:sensor histidine kinase n=1 Tax=Catenulispora sp. EB89 TaxID=3156257 RepID=UPI00351209A0
MTAALLATRPLHFRRTIRTRLTLAYTLLMLVLAGVTLLALYLFMRWAPTYEFPTTTSPHQATGAAQLTPVPVAAPSNVLTPAPGKGLVVRSTDTLLSTLLFASAAALAVLVCAAAGLGWIATGRMLRPLHDITVAARRAGSGRLDHRIALPGPQDELKELSDTFDAMLARLEQAFHAHQRFAANASHELRTPLATTQAVLDVALADPDGHDVAALARKLRVANRQSLDTVDALLDLADSAQGVLDGEIVDLAEAVCEAVAAVTDEARTAGIGLDAVLSHALVQADPVLLRQLLVNLMQNAVRHNTAGGTASVAVSVKDGSVTITVRNSGEVIPDAAIPLLTEPFYRRAGRTADTNGGPRGRGLGLALAATIAAAHGTQLVLIANARGGLTASVTFPLLNLTLGEVTSSDGGDR